MKSKLFGIVMLFAVAHANAYVVVNDRNSFASQFDNPSGLIDFSALKDGTVFQQDPGLMSSPLIATTSGHYASIGAEGWSNDIQIGSSDRNAGYWGATNWFGSYITPAGNGYYNSIYIDTGRQFQSISVETSIGFLGFIPDSSSDAQYLLPINVSVMSLRYGYAAVSAVPEPETYALMLAGLGLIGAVVRRRKASQV
jgi:hypothetical protein